METGKNMEILTIQNLQKSFGSKPVLRDVSFSVGEGSIFGFIGRNGAGKTTTMKIILGLLRADGGNVRICNETVTYGETSTNRLIGYLPDVPEFYPYMRAKEYLRLCGEITGLSGKELSVRIDELLGLVGLEKEKGKIGGYSRGMKQRLGIAQALIGRPKLLICDEPTSALDPVGRHEILDILLAAKEETSVLFSTHILSDVERISDHVALLEGGEVKVSGAIEEMKAKRMDTGAGLVLKDREKAERIKKGFPEAQVSGGRIDFRELSADEERRLFALLSEEMISVVRFERKEPDLEDLFMKAISGEENR